MKALKVFLWMTLILGLIYPLLITAIAQTTMHHKANGSMIVKSWITLYWIKFHRSKIHQ